MIFDIGEIMKRILKLAVLSFAASMTLNASAADAPGTGPNPFTDCGIGAALFSDTQWAAVTSNVIWDLGTTAVTSATLSPQTCSGKKVKTAMFIRDNQQQLAEQFARGEGEHVAAVVEMFNCNASQSQAAIRKARANVGQVVSAPGYSAQPQLEQAGQMYKAIEKAAASTCAA
jgi:hypothetical protein